MPTPTRYASELYPLPLLTRSFSIQDQEFELCPGLLSTVRAVELRSRSHLVRAAQHLGSSGRNATEVVSRYAQLQWYRAKGAEPPPDVQARYTACLTGDDLMPPEEATPEVAETKSPRGTRPYCRELINAGVTDEQELLAQVRAKFPGKPFTLGDVRGQLRVAGKLPWTKRKKA